jgi:leucyl/phenylalanyl-tRNA---protein transferase
MQSSSHSSPVSPPIAYNLARDGNRPRNGGRCRRRAPSLACQILMPILPPSRYFPPAEEADPEGVIGFGGKLTPEWLLDAYRHGIFPWPTGDPQVPIPWCSPDPRAVIELDRFHVPRRLARTCRSGAFRVTMDQDFAGVIRGCATANGRLGRTWLTPAMVRAYCRLFELGHAHSVEAWHGDELAGGTYGVAIAGLFSAESMFFRVRDASKVALVHLVAHLTARGYALLDIQQLTPHTEQFGAIEIPRQEYLMRVAAALERVASFTP